MNRCRNSIGKILITILSNFAFASVSHASLYRCTNPNGQFVYQEVPCKREAVEKVMEISPSSKKLLKWTPITETEASQAGISSRYVGLVKLLLKDPKSAEFGNIRFLKSDRGNYGVCGEVNAKNSFGGYTGRSGFLVLDKDAYLDSNDELSGMLYKAAARNMCEK